MIQNIKTFLLQFSENHYAYRIKNRERGKRMSNYTLEGEQFHIKEYDKQPPFSSFLPGLAGVRGIPMWVFYTNRGQGINSFGIHNKGNAIMEFNPAYLQRRKSESQDIK